MTQTTMVRSAGNETKVKSSLRLGVRCGGCSFLQRKHKDLDAPCSSLGKSGSSPGCKLFQPDYGKGRDMMDGVRHMSDLLSNTDEKTRHLLAYALINGTQLERVTTARLGKTLSIGQTVAINMSNPRVSYVNCYYRAYVMGVTPDNQSIICYSKINGRWVHSMLMMRNTEILTVKEFKTLKKRLIKEDRINAPASALSWMLPKVSKREAILETYKPPKLGTAERVVAEESKAKGKPRLKTPSYKVSVDKKGRKVVTI